MFDLILSTVWYAESDVYYQEQQKNDWLFSMHINVHLFSGDMCETHCCHFLQWPMPAANAWLLE